MLFVKKKKEREREKEKKEEGKNSESKREINSFLIALCKFPTRFHLITRCCRRKLQARFAFVVFLCVYKYVFAVTQRYA